MGIVIEGMVISCYAVGAKVAYIYIREEFPQAAEIVEQAIEEARKGGFLGKNIQGSKFDCEFYVHRGAGAYICGEETGLIESLEGKRPYPRIKPPYFPAAMGLYMAPTIVNNVVFNIPRAGINFNDGFGGANVIHDNLLFNTCRESSDHGE